MNTPLDPIEAALRAAPHPRPEASLRAKLHANITLPPAPPRRAFTADDSSGWLARWWPALTAGGLAFAGLVWIGVEQSELEKLRLQLETPAAPGATETPDAPSPTAVHEPSSVPITDGVEELQRLQAAAGQLSNEVGSLEGLRAENAQLKAAALAAAGLDPQQVAELEQARERAMTITCVNNLKQLGLAARIWANDHSDTMPPDMNGLTNYLGQAKVLVCPADSARTAAANWGELASSNISYEHLAPSADLTDPERVLFRCPVHGTVTLVDGSVQQIAKDKPSPLTVRDGKTYFQAQPVPAVDPVLRERYGLAPEEGSSGTPTPTPAPPQ